MMNSWTATSSPTAWLWKIWKVDIVKWVDEFAMARASFSHLALLRSRGLDSTDIYKAIRWHVGGFLMSEIAKADDAQERIIRNRLAVEGTRTYRRCDG